MGQNTVLMTRRRFLAGLCTVAGLGCAASLGLAACSPEPPGGAGASGAGGPRPFWLCGPALAETLPLLRLASENRPGNDGRPYRFAPWHSPDQLRALVAGGQADAAVLSLTAAATLKNRGLPVRVIALSSPPLWIVSTDPQLRGLADLEGQELCLPYGPGEFPDLLLGALARRSGLRLSVRHTGGGLETANLLLSGRARHAFLSEPAASLAVKRAGAGTGPALAKRVNLHAAWAELFPESPVLAHGALALCGGPADGDTLRAAYARESDKVASDPQHATKLAATLFPELARQAQNGVVPGSDIRLSLGPKAATGARFLLARLQEQSPQALGGRLPDAAFLELGA